MVRTYVSKIFNYKYFFVLYYLEVELEKNTVLGISFHAVVHFPIVEGQQK